MSDPMMNDSTILLMFLGGGYYWFYDLQDSSVHHDTKE